ncbi:unnamed protein product, partial [Oppiella nova]
MFVSMDSNGNRMDTGVVTGKWLSAPLANVSVVTAVDKGLNGTDTTPDTDVKLMDLDDFLHGIGVHMTQESMTEDEGEGDDSLDCQPSTTSYAAPVVNGSQHYDITGNGGQLAIGTDDTQRSYQQSVVQELKTHPMHRKSRKQVTPEEHKDERYWTKRAKNNCAAKRSRESRRQRENQIVLRANYLERENRELKRYVKRLEDENRELRKLLSGGARVMPLKPPDDSHLRKQSIFSILSEASIEDFPTIHSERTPSIAVILKTLATKQHSRISVESP